MGVAVVADVVLPAGVLARTVGCFGRAARVVGDSPGRFVDPYLSPTSSPSFGVFALAMTNAFVSRASAALLITVLGAALLTAVDSRLPVAGAGLDHRFVHDGRPGSLANTRL